MSASLGERLIALAEKHANRANHGTREDEFLTLALAAARLALEDAADMCEQLWRDGYRGEVSVGFAHRIRARASELAP